MFNDLLPAKPANDGDEDFAIYCGRLLNFNLGGVFRQLSDLEQRKPDLARKFYAAIADECRKRAER